MSLLWISEGSTTLTLLYLKPSVTLEWTIIGPRIRSKNLASKCFSPGGSHEFFAAYMSAVRNFLALRIAELFTCGAVVFGLCTSVVSAKTLVCKAKKTIMRCR